MAKFIALICLVLIQFSKVSYAEEQYQIFDGRFYNGLFYPNIDIIEWGEPTHLEFQIYDKGNQIDVSGVTIDSGGRLIFRAAVDFSFRGERRCRRIPAPDTFKLNQKLYYYMDKSDKDMNNIIISAFPMPGKTPYSPKDSSSCIEVAAVGNRNGPEVVKLPSEPLRTTASEKEPSIMPPKIGDSNPVNYEEDLTQITPKRSTANQPVTTGPVIGGAPGVESVSVTGGTKSAEEMTREELLKELEDRPFQPEDYNWFGN